MQLCELSRRIDLAALGMRASRAFENVNLHPHRAEYRIWLHRYGSHFGLTNRAGGDAWPRLLFERGNAGFQAGDTARQCDQRLPARNRIEDFQHVGN